MQKRVTSSAGRMSTAGPRTAWATAVINRGGNQADNLSIPTAGKCLTLFSAGGVCE